MIDIHTRGLRITLLSGLLAVVLSFSVAAQEGGTTGEEGPQAQALRTLIVEGPEALRYTEQFSRAVSMDQLREIIDSLTSQLGRFQGVEGEGNPYTLRYANGEAEAMIVLDGEGAVAGLRFTQVTPATASLEEAIEAFLALPGRVSLTILEEGELLRDGGESGPMAVGSSFKLAVLAAAERGVDSGEARWEEVLELEDRDRSLPTGILQDWPSGAPITLESAATLMISVSDNTATDLLIRRLGRQAIEEFAPSSRPLLTTREAFILKNPDNEEVRGRYLSSSTEERRALLEAGLDERLPGPELFTGEPVHPEIEWFFSTRELAALINRIRREELLAVSSGPFDQEQWAYIGYKGGSEPGVLNMTLSVRTDDGREYAVSATANRDAAIDTGEFLSALNAVLFHLR